MPNIQVLDPHVANLIAAGEVVERPASVAKELMENAIDAGASTVTVEINHGGLTFLRVTDDGKGIPADQLKTAFLRHATSKLRTEYDLEAIGTLGFRGEALAAISAVSRIEVLTRTAEADLGASLALGLTLPFTAGQTCSPLALGTLSFFVSDMMVAKSQLSHLEDFWHKPIMALYWGALYLIAAPLWAGVPV